MPEHNDWRTIQRRCCTLQRTEILELTYKALLEEAKVKCNAFLLSFELFTHLQKQEEYVGLWIKITCTLVLTTRGDLTDR